MKKFLVSALNLSAIILLFLASSCSDKTSSFDFQSSFYKIQLCDSAPFIKYFSVDGMGNNKLENNPVQWRSQAEKIDFELHKISGSEARIFRKGDKKTPLWEFKFGEKQFSVVSHSVSDSTVKGMEFRFAKSRNHTTLLGIMTARNKTKLPAILHMPDMGTLILEADRYDLIVDYDASRSEGNNFISVSLPAATSLQKKISYLFTIKSIYPNFTGVEDKKYSGFRRNYLNLFQINPKLMVLANNSCSDPCAFTLFLSSIMALKTPALADSLTALDLVRMSVERYLHGMKAYGMYGYNSSWENGDTINNNSKSQPYDYLDTYPSLVISACNYIKGSGDIKWAEKYYPVIKGWMDRQMIRDYNKNGLVEYELSGNSGSWNGIVRPANWWDTVGFGFEDAFSNAITYDALNLMVYVAGLTGRNEDAVSYKLLASKLKSIYFKTFYNPETGVLAGWKSRDGKLHDYYFLMVNSMAVYYNLVPEDKIKGVMLALWNKMQEAGFNDFTLGVPGNLVSVRHEDYTHHDPRWGGGERADGSDAFQRYENGGASLNWSYFTLKAFRKAGLEEQLARISEGILKSIDEGNFQGSCSEGGMTRDWKTWNGECWGYEGFLCDGYQVLLAFNPNDN